MRTLVASARDSPNPVTSCFAVATWLAATHHHADVAQQKHVITGHVVRQAQQIIEGGWRNRYRDSRHLSETVQAILDKYLPLSA